MPDTEFTPVVAPRGKLVHATSLHAPTKTACGKEFSGWRISLDRVSCRNCKLAIAKDCRPARGREKA